VKRTNATVCITLLAALFSITHCGDDGGETTGDAAAPSGGQGGMGGSLTGGSQSSSTGGVAGGVFGGSGGSASPDSGANGDCPAQRPPDNSACSMRTTCHYPDSVCNCVRVDGQDGGTREWNCFDLVARDGGTCPRTAPQDGDMCFTLGLRCPGSNQGTNCSCVSVEGGLEWRC
jgi:hypothetical protein